MWERPTFVLTSCRSNFSLPLIPVRFQSLQMLDDEIFSTKNCACGMARISCGVAPLLFALRIRVCILQPCLTLPHISWKRHPFIDHIDPWFCWISKMFPGPSDTIFPYVLPLTLPPLVTCIILHHLVSTSCLPTHAYSHPLKASARRTQLLKNLQKGLVPQQKTTDPTDFKVCHRSSQVFNASVLLHFHLTCLWSLWAATAIIMWHHVTSRYLSTSFLHAHFRAAPTFYSTCWSNLEQGAQKRETENIGGKITQQNKKDIQRTSVSVT